MKKGTTLMEMLLITFIISTIIVTGAHIINTASETVTQKQLEAEQLVIIEKQKLYYEKYGTFFVVDVEGE